MKLYQHQIDSLERTTEYNKVAYYHDMGLGKTFTGAEKMNQLSARKNLVVCQKSKVDDWVDHFRINYPGWDVFNLTHRKAGGHDPIIDFVSGHSQMNRVVGIINYDLIWRRPKLSSLKNFTLMLDESSLIQNPTSKRSKFILKLDPTNVILLSGTPVGGKYENLWSQMHLLGWNISKQMYMRQYVEVEYLDTLGRSIPIVTGYKNVDRLKSKMNKFGCDFLKTDEVFELPEQMFEVVKVNATKEYQHFRKNSYVEIDGTELAGYTTLTQILYERQLCGQYNKEKAAAMMDLFNSTSDSFAVFYNFDEELEVIKKVAEGCEREVGVISGKEKSGKKMLNYSLKHNFNRCTPILVIQYQAGSMGLNLQKFTSRIVYFSLPLSSELYEQSKKRIHRIGTKNTCFYYILICKNSIEEKILATLKKRRDYTNELFEDGCR